MRIEFSSTSLFQKARLIIQSLMKAATMVGGRKSFETMSAMFATSTERQGS